jgi:hypothetical protein
MRNVSDTLAISTMIAFRIAATIRGQSHVSREGSNTSNAN